MFSFNNFQLAIMTRLTVLFVLLFFLQFLTDFISLVGSTSNGKVVIILASKAIQLLFTDRLPMLHFRICPNASFSCEKRFEKKIVYYLIVKKLSWFCFLSTDLSEQNRNSSQVIGIILLSCFILVFLFYFTCLTRLDCFRNPKFKLIFQFN